jgi:hypothetical protein
MTLAPAALPRLLASLGEAGRPLTLAEVQALHLGLDRGDVGRGLVRLAMTGVAAVEREDGHVRAVITEAGAAILAPRAACLTCGMQDPPPDQTCTGDLDHGVGREAGCPYCGRLALACAWRPCEAMRERLQDRAAASPRAPRAERLLGRVHHGRLRPHEPRGPRRGPRCAGRDLPRGGSPMRSRVQFRAVRGPAGTVRTAAAGASCLVRVARSEGLEPPTF